MNFSLYNFVVFCFSFCFCFNSCKSVLNAANASSGHSPTSSSSNTFAFIPSIRAQISNVSVPKFAPNLSAMNSAQNYSTQKLLNRNKEILSRNRHLNRKINKNKSVKVLATVSSEESFLPKERKSCFNYENQLEIMLENQMQIIKQRILLNRTVDQKSNFQKKTLPYNVLALKSAKFEMENLRKQLTQFDSESQTNYDGQMISGGQLIMIIANAMRGAIDFFNNSMLLDKGDQVLSKSAYCAEEEQLRFVGLVLWHLLFRDCPIIDPIEKEFVFIAKIEPTIDASDPNVAKAFCDELDNELARKREAMPKKEEKKVLPKELKKEFEKEFELLERMEKKLFNEKEGHEDVKMEKYNELYEKFELLKVYWGWEKGKKWERNVPFYDIIDRAFIAYGREAPTLVVFVRALLEGVIGWADFSKYVQNPTQNTIRINGKHEKFHEMMRQMTQISDKFDL